MVKNISISIVLMIFLGLTATEAQIKSCSLELEIMGVQATATSLATKKTVKAGTFEGYPEFKLPEGKYKITVTSVGYKTTVKQINLVCNIDPAEDTYGSQSEKIIMQKGSRKQIYNQPPTDDNSTTAGIRTVDFKNFDYGSPPCSGGYGNADVAVDKLILKNGHQQQGNEMSYADLGTVNYVDFDGDGIEEAFIVIKGQIGNPSDKYLTAYAFAFRNNSTKQIWTRCDKNAKAVLEGNSIVFTFPHLVQGVNTVDTNTYGWKGSQIDFIFKKRKKN